MVNILRAIKCNFLKSFLPPGRNQLQNKVYLHLCGHESFALPSVFCNLQNCKIAQTQWKAQAPIESDTPQRVVRHCPAPLKGHLVILLSISKLFSTFSDTAFLIPTSQSLTSLLFVHYNLPLNASFSGEVIQNPRVFKNANGSPGFVQDFLIFGWLEM